VLPLKGLVVLAFEQALAGPLATRLLHDQGATVIKVERPGSGDLARHYEHTNAGVSSYFAWLNHGKESVALDLKTAGGLEVAHRLADRADVILQNYIPGAMTRLGLGPRQLRRRRPELIYASVSGYGESGPYAQRKAYDLLIQAETGVVAVTGDGDLRVKAGVSLCDIAAATQAAIGILGAVAGLRRDGHGATLSVSMFEASLDWTSPTLGLYLATGVEPRPVGLHHLHIAPYGPFRCGDGGSIFLVTQQDREWHDLCVRVFDRTDLAVDPRFALMRDRMANRSALHEAIEDVLAGAPAAEWEAKLVDAGMPTARLRGVAEVATHPVVAELELLRSLDTNQGEVRMPRAPLHTSAGETGGGAHIPDVGEHTDTWLRRLGYTASQRRALRTGGAVG